MKALGRRGVALMLVLWLIVVLGAVATGVATATRGRTRLVDNLRARAEARYAAESGVVAAQAKIEHRLRESAGPDGWARAWWDVTRDGALEERVGALRFRMAVTDLGSRIDLNEASEDVVAGLLRELFGARGDRMAHALEDHDRFVRVDALTYLPAFDDSALTRLAPFITVWGDGRVNVNTAPREVLAAIPEIGPDGAAAIVGARERDGVFVSRLSLAQRIAERRGTVASSLGPITTVPSRILVVSRGWTDGHPLTHEIQVVFEVVRAFLDSPMRLHIRYWHERDL